MYGADDVQAVFRNPSLEESSAIRRATVRSLLGTAVPAGIIPCPGAVVVILHEAGKRSELPSDAVQFRSAGIPQNQLASNARRLLFVPLITQS